MTDDHVKPATRRAIDWRRMLAEGVLIVGSVYLAIYLEGVSNDRQEVDEARTTLAQLQVDLEEDRRDLAEILEEQRTLAGLYADLDRWLATPAAMPVDSVEGALDFIAYHNRTMFPRKGAWTTMLAEGYLGALDDAELVARLGAFYGRIAERIEHNGALYDQSLSRVSGEIVPSAWDYERRRPAADPDLLRLLRGQLRFMRKAWNDYYVDLLMQYQEELDATIEAVEGYLAD